MSAVAPPSGGACDECIRRTWLLAELAGHLESERGRIDAVLELPSLELLATVGGRRRGELVERLGQFEPSDARAQAHRSGLELLCRCCRQYPDRLRQLTAPPAVLHIGGGFDRFQSLCAAESVAIVGARRASNYGREVARTIGRELAVAGVTVISGMALGIDGAAHEGALAGGGATIAVLPGGAERPYPASHTALHRRILATGATVSELPAGTAVRRWMFPARNRVIAALATVAVVVEATERSGALLTALAARELGRPVGAVPGRVTAPGAAGCNELLASGALMIRGAQDVLDLLFGAGTRTVAARQRPELDDRLGRLVAAIGDGASTSAALARAGLAPESGLAALAWLELTGYIRREPGGRFAVQP